MVTQRDIDKELAILAAISGSYKAPKIDSSILKGLGNYGKVDYSKLGLIDWSGFAGNPTNKKSGKKKKNKINLWDILSGTLGQLGGAVTDQAYNVLADVKGLKKNHDAMDILKLLSDMNPTSTISRGVTNGGKEQWKKWSDGKFSLGDIPGIGFLHGMDKGWKRGENIMQDIAGVDNRWGKLGGGLAIDIAGDPLTYLTGGLSAATKVKNAAELAKAVEVARKAGAVGKFRKVDEAITATRDVLTKRYTATMTEPLRLQASRKYKSEELITKFIDDTIKKNVDKRLAPLENAIKGAGSKAFDGHINSIGLSIPFTNKFGQLGTYSEKLGKFNNPLFRSEAKVPSHLVSDLLDGALDSKHHKGAIKKILKFYNVEKLADLTKTQFDDLAKRLEPMITAKSGSVNNALGKGLPDAVSKLKTKYGNTPDLSSEIDNLLEQIDNPKKFRKSVEELAEKVKVTQPKLAKDIEYDFERLTEVLKHGTTGDRANLGTKAHILGEDTKIGKIVDKVLNGEYTGLNNAKTGFEHWMDAKSPFNARTLQTGDKFVDSMADHIADADSMKIGEMGRYNQALHDIQKFIKKSKLTPDDMKAAIYVLEGQAPKALKNFQPNEKQQQLADMIKPLLERIGDDDKAAGVLKQMRKAYFPHIVNKTEKEIEKIKEFMAKNDDPAKVTGKSAQNKNAKARNGFQTLAEKDDYVAELSKRIAKETDPETKEKLYEQQKRVAEMFDTDIVSALTRRAKEGIRSRAMKEMQGEFKKFGMMADYQKAGLERIPKDVAKKLGLESVHYMHPAVMNGLKRVDNVFTSDGMNKFVRHVSAINDIFRSLVTHYKPTHYRNNFIGNTVINMAAGVKASDYAKAGKLLIAMKKGKLTPEQTKLLESAYKHNVLSGGFLSDAGKSFKFDDPTKLEKAADKVAHNRFITKVKITGEFVDDFTRLANYLNGIEKYGTSAKAAHQVREYLFNYNELTNADRHMRTVVPFWNWMKRNIPLQLKLLMENPKFALNAGRTKELFNKGQEGEDWQKDSGIKIGDKYYSLPLPTSDLNTFLDPLHQLGGSLTPAAKAPIEWMMNKKMFNGLPISYGEQDAQMKDLPSYLAHNLGIVGNGYDLVTGKDSISEALKKLFNTSYKVQN